MSGLSPELRDVLVYLDEIGYGELYLKRQGVGPHRDRLAGPERPLPRSAEVEAQASPTAGGRPPAPSQAATSGPAARAAALRTLAAEAETCESCGLSQGRNRVVFGTGDPDADLMFVGEGPGAEEDRQGLPFVGAAGQLLDKIVEAIGLAREQVYIANVVKCRPPGNRDPLPDEAAACRSYLDRQIELVQPKVIVALGRVAAQSLLGNDLPLGRMRGRWFKVGGVPTMVTYHPAALLRNRAWKRPTWEDMQAVRDRLRE